MNSVFSCTCGATEWHVTAPRTGTRLMCYCADCQTFARHLGADILGPAGGSDLLQISPAQVSFVRGAENLALLKLSPKGLSRWHTSCCNTPVCNTLKSAKLPFVSLFCASHQGEDRELGRVVAHANTVFGHGPHKPAKDRGLGRLVISFAKRILGDRMSGQWKATPFFAPPDWSPVAAPHVITKEERNRARP